MNDGTSDDSDSGSANSRSSADEWKLVMTELRKRRRDASRVRRQHRAKFEDHREAPADNPAPARDEEDAARVGSKPSARTAPRSPDLASTDDRTEQQPSPAGKEPLPGVV